MLIDNFEQQFESSALNAQNVQKSAPYQLNSFNISKNELVKFFRGFRVFEYTLWQKNENPEMPEINKKLSKLENTHC